VRATLARPWSARAIGGRFVGAGGAERRVVGQQRLEPVEIAFLRGCQEGVASYSCCSREDSNWGIRSYTWRQVRVTSRQAFWSLVPTISAIQL
jgi:hypothetical protein